MTKVSGEFPHKRECYEQTDFQADVYPLGDVTYDQVDDYVVHIKSRTYDKKSKKEFTTKEQARECKELPDSVIQEFPLEQAELMTVYNLLTEPPSSESARIRKTWIAAPGGKANQFLMPVSAKRSFAGATRGDKIVERVPHERYSADRTFLCARFFIEDIYEKNGQVKVEIGGQVLLRVTNVKITDIHGRTRNSDGYISYVDVEDFPKEYRHANHPFFGDLGRISRE